MVLRTLIQQVIVHWQTSDTVEVCIVWISGHYTTLQFVSTISRTQDLAQYETLKKRIHDLWGAGMKDKEIAAQVTLEGFHSARSTRVSEATVYKIRLRYHWLNTPDNSERYVHSESGYLSVRDLAALLSCDAHWVHRQIEQGRIDAVYLKRCPPRNTYLIQDHPDLLASLRKQRQQAEELGQRRLATKTRKQLPTMMEAAADKKQNALNS